ncbi:MAG: alpha/beta hydrolase, partial [Chitinophagaceae bacterium]|nr:alpha/beta hydrolase [Chitinophagaceae bacterium]
MADDINSLLEQLNIDSAYVFGQSDGAIIGLIMAFRYPRKVKMLAAMAPNTRPDSAVFYPEAEIGQDRNIALTLDSIKMGNLKAVNKLKLLRLMQYHPHITKEQLSTIKAPVLV